MGFGFRELDVWRKSVMFADKVISLAENLDSNRKHYRLIENIEASAASVAANIAEGSGRAYKKEFIQFLYISRGSLYEVITFLDIFSQKKWISDADYDDLLKDAEEVVKMLAGLIKSLQK